MKKISYLKAYGLSFLSVTCALSIMSLPGAIASDHVDSPIVTINPGPTTGVNSDGKFTTILPEKSPMGKMEDITDVYVFREGDQTGNSADNANLVFIMTLNGLVPPGQSNQFSSDIDYVFKIATDKNNLDNNQKNISVRFGSMNQSGQQTIFVNGKNAGKTTPFNGEPIINQVSFDKPANTMAKVFAGETDDPFFLDFRIVTEGLGAGVSGTGSVDRFRKPADTFGNSNVNAIVLSVPVSWLQADMNPMPSTFHVWGTTNK